MKPAFQIIIVFLLSIMLSSCSIHLEKRRYNPGYHVEIIKKHPRDIFLNANEKKIQDQNTSASDVPCSLNFSNKGEIRLDTANERKKTISEIVIKRGGDCDIAYLKNGKTLLCTYIQITDVIFTYKTCGGKTTDVNSLDVAKVDFIVLNKGDTIYPENKMYEWKKEHGETDAKTRKQLLRRGVSGSTVTITILYFIFAILAFGAGIPLLIWCIYNLGLWILAGGILLIFLAVGLIIGGGLLIILAIINAVRK